MQTHKDSSLQVECGHATHEAKDKQIHAPNSAVEGSAIGQQSRQPHIKLVQRLDNEIAFVEAKRYLWPALFVVCWDTISSSSGVGWRILMQSDGDHLH
jgi:hypothetical protein